MLSSRLSKYLIPVFIFYKTRKAYSSVLLYNIPFTSMGFFSIKIEKDEHKSIQCVVEKADQLYEEERYSEVYDFLKQYNNKDCVEIKWRICRALYKLANGVENIELNRQRIEEAHYIINSIIEKCNTNANVHKWMAILIHSKNKSASLTFNIDDVIKIKEHLMEAHRLNPNDVTVLYMLGKWCYKISTITWFQRKIFQIFYKEPPTSSMEDALKYFLKVEEVKPRIFIPNLYMLGKINYKMGNMYRARYYLNIVANMTAYTEYERKCIEKAHTLAEEVKDYDVSEHAL